MLPPGQGLNPPPLPGIALNLMFFFKFGASLTTRNWHIIFIYINAYGRMGSYIEIWYHFHLCLGTYMYLKLPSIIRYFQKGFKRFLVKVCKNDFIRYFIINIFLQGFYTQNQCGYNIFLSHNIPLFNHTILFLNCTIS